MTAETMRAKSWKKLAAVSLFLLILPTLPLIGLVALLLYITRAILTLYKNAYKPQLGEFLSGANNLFSSENPYEQGKNPVAIIVLCVSIKGRMTMREIHRKFNRKLDEFWNKNSQDPWFPELHQYLTNWMGFSIWKNEHHFQISDHVLNLIDFGPAEVGPDFIVTEDSLTELSYKLSSTPFPSGRSPWQILTHCNEEEDETTWVFLRFHHSLGDGMSVLKFLSHLCDLPGGFEEYVKKFRKSLLPVEKSRVSKVVYAATFAVLGLYEAIQHIFDVWDENEWHKSGSCKTYRRNFRYTRLDTLEIAKVKKIREVQGQVRFVPILLAALTGGLRKYMMKYGIPVPDKIHTVSTIPIPKKANRLNNNLIFANLAMPTGLNDRTEIVQVLDRESQVIRSSRVPIMMLALITFIGLFPRKWIIKTVNWKFTTSFMSNVPGPDKQMDVFGYPTNVHGFMSAIPESSNGIYYWIVGFGGDIKINLGVSDDIVPSMEHLQEIRKFVEEEFRALEDPQNKIIVPPIENKINNNYCS